VKIKFHGLQFSCIFPYSEKKLKEDPYLSPYAQAELAFMMLDDEQYDNAKKLLDHVK
jgi:hypothetical protein